MGQFALCSSPMGQIKISANLQHFKIKPPADTIKVTVNADNQKYIAFLMSKIRYEPITFARLIVTKKAGKVLSYISIRTKYISGPHLSV